MEVTTLNDSNRSMLALTQCESNNAAERFLVVFKCHILVRITGT